MMVRMVLIASLLAGGFVAPVMAAPDRVLADFEGGTYGGWSATGDAFGDAPAAGTLPGQQAVSGFEGAGLVNTYRNGDRSTGTLTSPEFSIDRPFINFLIGGGAHDKTSLQLLVDGAVVRSASGSEDERLEWESWDVSDVQGRKARLRIVDEVTGTWGHVNLDQIMLSDTRKVDPQPLYRESLRPQFHFTSARNWLNDPNGMVFYNGHYHLFFQHNPDSRAWGNMTWGHAVSPDMVHWVQRPNAIERDALGTIFSGSAVVDWKNTSDLREGDDPPLVALYTAAGGTSPESQGQKFTQCLAYSTDAGKTWRKYPGNPVLGHIRAENRDPKVIWHEPSQAWIMALYLEGNDFSLYRSPDLKRWSHLQDFRVEGTDECPDFFPMPVEGEAGLTKWVFTGANARYLIGDFDGKTFTPDGGDFVSAQSDFGALYAVQSFSDVPDGRRIQIGWMRGGKYPRMPFNQQMSFPTTLALRRMQDGLRLFRAPVKEIEALRTGKVASERDRQVGLDGVPVPALAGDLLDVDLTLEPGDADAVGVRVRGQTIRYSAADGTLAVAEVRAPVQLPGGRLQLRLLVDRRSIEVFANEGSVSLHVCYLPDPDTDAAPLTVFAEGKNARIVSLQGYPLRSAWMEKTAAPSPKTNR